MNRFWETAIENSTFVDYTKEYQDNLIQEIKQQFYDECKEDDTLSLEYKNHISNFDNIRVKINYGPHITLKFDSLTVKIKYDYKDYYEDDKYYSGDVKFGYDGKKYLENVEEHSTIKSQKATMETTVWIRNLKNPKGVVSIAWRRDSADYVARKNFIDLSPEFQDVLRDSFQEKEVIRRIRFRCLPSKEEVYKEIKNDRENISNVKILEIEDFSADEVKVTFLPCSFDVFTTYKNNTYGKYNVETVEEITSVGEKSTHFNAFNDVKNKIEKNKAITFFPRLLSIFGSLVPLILFMGIYAYEGTGLMSPEFSKKIINGFPVRMMISFAIAIVGIILSIKLIKKYKPHYKSNIDTNCLVQEIKRNFKKRFGKNIMIAIIIAFIGVVVGFLTWFVI